MDKKQGQIAEYGTPEFENNRSIRTVLEKGIHTNLSTGLQRNAELYHRSPGYKPAGSCAIYTNEVWGYAIYQEDGTITGKNSSNKQEILDRWNEITFTR